MEGSSTTTEATAGANVEEPPALRRLCRRARFGTDFLWRKPRGWVLGNTWRTAPSAHHPRACLAPEQSAAQTSVVLSSVLTASASTMRAGAAGWQEPDPRCPSQEQWAARRARQDWEDCDEKEEGENSDCGKLLVEQALSRVVSRKYLNDRVWRVVIHIAIPFVICVVAKIYCVHRFRVLSPVNRSLHEKFRLILLSVY